MWRLDGDLDPVGGSIVAKVVRGIEQELFEVDWAEAKARLGDRVTVAGNVAAGTADAGPAG